MPSKRVDVLESGKVYFFFRAEVEEAAEKLEEAQRMFVVLIPDEPQPYRLLVIRRRSFSLESQIDKTSGFVDRVSGEPKCVEDRLAPDAHQREISGESHLPALRPIGEGARPYDGVSKSAEGQNIQKIWERSHGEDLRRRSGQ